MIPSWLFLPFTGVMALTTHQIDVIRQQPPHEPCPRKHVALGSLFVSSEVSRTTTYRCARWMMTQILCF